MLKGNKFFKLYYLNWMSGTRFTELPDDMRLMVKGAYIDLLTEQADRAPEGALTTAVIKGVCGSLYDVVWPVIKHKFVEYSPGKFINTKLQKVIAKKPAKKAIEGKVEVVNFVKLTQKETNSLIEKHGNANYKMLINQLSDYKLSSGKKYASDYGAINVWGVESLKQKNKYINIRSDADAPTTREFNPETDF